MGVVYKLTPPIKEFILKAKAAEKGISCRQMAKLVKEKFGLDVSKSSVNILIKEAGLSNPVGRPSKKKRKKANISQRTKGIILKAVDSLFKGEDSIFRLLSKYKLLPEGLNSGELFQDYLYQRRLKAIVDTYSDSPSLNSPSKSEEGEAGDNIMIPNELQSEIYNLFVRLSEKVHLLKIVFGNGKSFYFDPYFRSLYTHKNLDAYIDIPRLKAMSYIKRFFQEKEPLIVLVVPGYETISLEFWHFLQFWSEGGKGFYKAFYHRKEEALSMEKLILMDSSEGVIDALSLAAFESSQSIIFSLWPHQFEKYINLKLVGNSFVFYFSPLRRECYLQEAAIEIRQPYAKESVVLRAIVVKEARNKPYSLIICTNLAKATFPSQKIAEIYLERWPNLEEGMLNFTHRIDPFSYYCESQAGGKEEFKKGKNLTYYLDRYILMLDSYVRKRLLPGSLRDKELEFLRTNFYNLEVEIKEKSSFFQAKFVLPSSYLYIEELSYLCHRLNEEEIFISEKKVWFLI